MPGQYPSIPPNAPVRVVAALLSRLTQRISAITLPRVGAPPAAASGKLFTCLMWIGALARTRLKNPGSIGRKAIGNFVRIVAGLESILLRARFACRWELDAQCTCRPTLDTRR